MISLAISLSTKGKDQLLAYTVIESGLTLDNVAFDEKIIQLKKRVGEENLLKAIYGIIAASTQYFNVRENINDVQAIQTAALIIENYPAETMTDLMLCLKRAKLGEYGPVFNTLDGRNIMNWFRKYLEQKYEAWEQRMHNEKMRLQAESTEVLGKIGHQIIKQIEAKEHNVVEFKSGEEIEIENLQRYVEKASDQDLKLMQQAYEREAAMSLYNKFERQLKIIEEAQKQN